MSMLLTTAAALSAALATEPVATPVATLSAPAPRPTLSEPAPVPEAPAATEGIRALLRARHTEDLPDRAVLDAHHGAEEVLQWLA
ncbi:MAG TPA: hypothetical protein DFR83_27530, partial [Deltaproteobacteria bacterium]|nr:hypothetical protein [Deltaproteobacteria bacterium]